MDTLALLGILGLAAYRATRLVVHDSIAQPFRDRIEMWHARDIESRWRTFVRDLIGCPYCAGWWLSLVTVLTWQTATGAWAASWGPLFRVAVSVWAVAGVQALLNRWDDTRKDG